MKLKSEDWILELANPEQLKAANILLSSKGYSTQYCELSDYPTYDALQGTLDDGDFDITLCKSKSYPEKERITFEEFVLMIIGDGIFFSKIGDYNVTYKSGEENVSFGNIKIPFSNIMKLGEFLDKNNIIPADWYLPISDKYPEYIDFISNYIKSKGMSNQYVNRKYTGYNYICISKSDGEFCMDIEKENYTREITTQEFFELFDKYDSLNSVSLSENYKAINVGDIVKVGCQEIPIETAKEFINQLKEYK